MRKGSVPATRIGFPQRALGCSLSVLFSVFSSECGSGSKAPSGGQSALAVTTASLPQGTVGTAYSATLQASGGVAPYAWTLAAGQLPPGLVLSGSGAITGAPLSVGTFSFKVQVQGSLPDIATAAETIVVVGTVVTTTSLPQGTVGTAYLATLQASGGATPYTWALASGRFPPGLAISASGTISGTPASAGTFNFNVQVQGSPTDVATAPESIVIVGTSSGACGSPGGNESLLRGQYAFLLQGTPSPLGLGAIVGTLTADGAGNITAGEQDLNLGGSSGPTSTQNINAANNAYTVGPDKRGCIALTTSAGTSVYSFVLGSVTSGVAAKGQLVETDGVLWYGALKLRDPAAFSTLAINGNYAFGMSSPVPGRLAVVGALTASSGTVSSGALDFAASDGVVLPPYPINPYLFTGTDTVDSNGRAALAFVPTTGFPFTLFSQPLNSVCYVVSASELYCVSSDDQTVIPLLVGDVLQQSGPFSNASLNGNSVRYSTGIGSTRSTRAEIGLVTADGTGNFSYNVDTNDAGAVSSSSAAGTYDIASNGRVATTIQGGTLSTPVFYMASTNRAFWINTTTDASFGLLEPQFGRPFSDVSLRAPYASGTVVLTARTLSPTTGELVLDGSGNISATIDTSTFQVGSFLDVTLGGTYSVASNGRGTITFNESGGTVNEVFYAISPAKLVRLPVDPIVEFPSLVIAEQ